ncbi:MULTISPECIES: TetR/AcrR family transcriptional regulator [Aestuariimicrobium]|uniref:TetR/AcrR family transcriptional regulator n=1 Tax=Aestuariimicrobium TaxID=396388 RepID=UPI0003B6773F|nr:MULTISPECIES: TetR/AcrR family transcriptional regulator [Aestuariimicrobium]CAI9403252.1 HTH-type transcriptional regulator BetI [Aestuariimicrobium sp. T2.26MG-19.2B]
MTVTARRAATRSKLLDGASRVVVRKGVGAATVEDICEEAGFTRGAFYSNFESKDDLLVALLDHHGSRINDMARQVIERSQINEDCDLNAVISRAIHEFVDSGVIAPWVVVLMSELQTHAVREPSIREAFTRARVASQQAKADMISSALAGHNLRLSLDGATAMQVLEGASNKYLLDQLSEGREPDLEGLVDVIHTVLTALVVAQ